VKRHTHVAADPVRSQLYTCARACISALHIDMNGRRSEADWLHRQVTEGIVTDDVARGQRTVTQIQAQRPLWLGVLLRRAVWALKQAQRRSNRRGDQLAQGKLLMALAQV